MKNVSQKLLGTMLQQHVVSPLMHGSCGLSEEELIAMASSLCHIEKNIDQTCRILHNCDPKTLKRWEDDPDLDFPKHHKDCGGKTQYWLDELEIWMDEHPDIINRVDEKRKNK